MRRFRTEAVGDRTEIELGSEESNHIRRVLRMEPGAEIVLTDNSGFEYLARLLETEGGAVRCRIEEKRRSESELCVAVTVYQAVIKGDHFDYAVQKMTEAGAGRIVPFLAERCVRRPKKEANFLARAQRIAAEAAKQCERAVTPAVAEITEFQQVLRDIRGQFTIFAYEREDALTLRGLLEETGCPACASLVIGPEGGFTEAETAALCAAGAHSVSLGPRILRSETAAVYVLAQLSYACCS